MAELAGDRLASGGSFGRIIIWNLADFSQLASLEGHRDFVRCLAALDGGLLASGSGDMTIRVRPLLDEATRRIMECSSAFEFECLAGGLGDLLAAALQQFEECPAHILGHDPCGNQPVHRVHPIILRSHFERDAPCGSVER